jgi:hypothetical protein
MRLLGVSIALAVVACRRPPSDVLGESAERAHSWIAGAEMTADLWTSGRVPSGFAQVALRDAQRGLEAERARLGRKAEVMKDPRVAEAVSALDAASVAASRMGAALTRGGDERAAARGEIRSADHRIQTAARR